jgi:CRP-like cAMP-binding protein
MDSSEEKNKAGPSCEFQQNLEILRQIEFFAGLPMETLKVFAYLCSREMFAAEDYLYHQDDDDGQAVYIISGQMLLIHAADGHEETIRSCQPGEFIGGLSLLASGRRLFALKAGQDTECMVMTREKFAKAIEQFPELVPRILRAVVDSIRSWDQQILFAMQEKGLSLEGTAGISAL